MGARETPVVKACREVLWHLGIPNVRLNSGMAWRGKFPIMLADPGWPDIIGTLKGGRTLGVECKAPEILGLWRKKKKGVRSPDQIRVHNMLIEQGALILTVSSSGEMVRDLEDEGYGR